LTHTESRRKDWSLEARIDSPRDNALHGLAGLYYYREDDGAGYTSAFTNPAGTAPVPIGSVIGFVKTPSQDDSAVRNWSVFSLVEYKVSEDLSLTAEGRYQVDKIISDQAINLAGNPLLEEEYKKFLPRATALYNLNEDWNIYANVAKGNKPGGFNSLPTDADLASRADLVANAQSFREESAWTYEVGVKGANEDRTITLNSSAYWIDWSDQQLSKGRTYTRINGTANTASLIQNAGRSRIQGFEVDVNAKPADAFDFRVGYAYNRAEIRDFLDDEQEDLYDTDGLVGPFNRGNDPSGQTRGQRLPQTPAHQIILSGNFTQPLSGEWTGFIRSDLTYESKRYAQVDNLQHTGDSYIMNIRTGVENDALSVTLFVNNALDDRTPAIITRIRDFSRFLQIPNRIPTNPVTTTFYRDYNAAYPRKRSFGVTANYKF
jgi:outer membrane receptor protein involved in Fe transport